MFKVSLKLVCTFIYVVFYHKRKRTRCSVGISCDEKYWDGEFISNSHPDFKELSLKLNHYINLANAAITMTRQKMEDKATVYEVKKNFQVLMHKNQIKEFKDLNVRVEFTMLKDFEDFVEKRRKDSKNFSESTIKKYITVLNILREFETHLGSQLDVDVFDKHMCEQMKSFLLFQKNLRNNTIAKHMSVMRAFYGAYYPGADRSFFTYKQYRPEVIALYENELMLLIETPFHGIKEKVKDLFVFMSLTGMRFSDVHRFSPAWVEQELIIYSAIKTKSKAYVPVTETVQGILEKYDGYPPKMSEQYFNRTLKDVLKDCGMTRPIIKRHRQGKEEIEEIMPLWEAVSSHTGRKTFISLMLARQIPIQDVMNMSGHQDYRSMKPYIMVSMQHMRKYKDILGL